SALDFVTDLGVFLSEFEREEILTKALRFCTARDEVEEALQSLYEMQPEHDLEPEGSRDRLRCALEEGRRDGPRASMAACTEALRHLERIRPGQPGHWLALLQCLRMCDIGFDVWDVILLGAASLEGLALEQYKQPRATVGLTAEQTG